MPGIDYLPRTEAELVIWLDAFSQKIPYYQTTFGLPPAEVTAVRNDYLWFNWSVLQVEVFKNELSQRVVFKDNVIDGPVGSLAEPVPATGTQQSPAPPVVAPGILPRLRALVQRIKRHPAYTDSIGQDLGVVSTAPALPAVTKPMGEVLSLPGGQFKVNFVKGGFTGVVVECQHVNATTWTSLGLRVRSGSVIDAPATPPGTQDVFRFRMRYTDGDTPVGLYSDEFKVAKLP